MSKDVIETIEKILKRGNSCEIKQERDNIVVVEIKRKVEIKTPIIG